MIKKWLNKPITKTGKKTTAPKSSSKLVLFAVIFIPIFSLTFAIYPYTRSGHSYLGDGKALAAPNNTINFQARLLRSNGALVPDGDYNVEFKIYDSLSSGSSAQGVCSLDSSTDDCWWYETRTGANKVTVKNGYLTASLGSVTAFGSNIPWDQQLYITMNIGGIGAPTWDGEMTPRMRVTSVPYAFKASEATQLKVTDSGFTSTLSVTTPTANRSISLPNASGTVAVSASGNIALDAAGNITLTGQVPIANGGTGASTAQSAINALSGMTTTGDLLYFNGTNSVPLARGANGECLTSNTTTILWSACGGGGGGITTVGALDGGTANANGATISGSTIYLQSASASYAGVVNTAAQTFAGTKTFNDGLISVGNVLASSTATGTTGTTEATARTNVTTVTLTAAGSFANNDVIFINNAGQDYYTRIVSGGGTTTLTVSPAVSYDASASVTKYTIQNIGATTSDYTTQSNRFFQGYFTGGVVTGAGSTVYSDGVISASPGLTVSNPTNSTTAFKVQNASGASQLTVDTTNSRVVVATNTSASGSWVTGLSILTNRYSHTAVNYNNKMYVWGGYTSNAVNTLEAYNYDTNTWSTLTSGGTARYGHIAHIYNGKMYSWGGRNSSGIAINTMDIYDIASDTWSTGASGGTARSGVSVLYNGKIYIYGGSLNSVDIYDIAGNSWTTGVSGGSGWLGSSAVVYGGKMYIFGGNFGASIKNNLDIYDLVANSWTTGLSGPTARQYHTANVYGTKMYVWGGHDGATSLNTMDIYDLNSGTWSTGTSGGIARFAQSATVYGTKMYVVGGTHNSMSTFEFGALVPTQFVFGGGTSDPSSAQNGSTYYNLSTKTLRCYDDSLGAWQNCNSNLSGSYILNGTTLQTANFNIQSSSANSVTATINGASSQTADIIQVKANGVSNPLFGISATGATAFHNSTNSTTAFAVQNTNGVNILNIDTTNGEIELGNYNGGTNPVNGKLVVNNSSNTNTITIQSGVTSGSYSLTLPTALGASGDCIKDTNGSGVLGFGACGSTTTLQGAYDAGSAGDQVVALSTTNDSVIFRNPSSSGTDSAYVLKVEQLNTGGGVDSLLVSNSGTGNILTLQNGSTTVLGVNSTGNLIANSASTATTGTTEATARTNVTTVTLTAAGSFANNDIIFINNAGQDYYTRIVSGGGTTTLTVSPAVSYDVSATVTKYTAQNIGATTTDYTTQSNRFFQGYFLGGVVTGAGSTTLSDGNLTSSNALKLQTATGTIVQSTGNNTTAFQIQNSGGTNLFTADTTNTLLKVADITPMTASAYSSGTVNTVAATNDAWVGRVVTGSDGFARIVYLDYTTHYVKYVKCSNSACTVSTSNDLYFVGNGQYANNMSLSIGSDGNADISFGATFTNSIEYIGCLNDTCSSYTNQRIYTGSTQTAITTGSDNYARIVYKESGTNDAKFVQCTNNSCSSSNTTTIDTGNTAYYDMAIGGDGYPRITYTDAASSGALVFIRCQNDDCSTKATNTPVASNGYYSKLKIGSDGFGRVAYSSGSNDVRLLICSNADCSSSTNVAIGNYSNGNSTSFDLGLTSTDLARLTYHNGDDLKLYTCTNNGCTAGSETTVQTAAGGGSAIRSSTISLSGSNTPYIAFQDPKNTALKFINVCTNCNLTGLSVGSNSSKFANLYVNNITADSVGIKSIVDGTSAFYVQNSGGSTLFTGDTLNNRVGIGTASPTKTLDVRGDALFKNTSNSTTAFQIQNAAGTALFKADTYSGNVYVGSTLGKRAMSDNFESGDFGLWQEVSDRTAITIDTSVVRGGKYSAKLNFTGGGQNWLDHVNLADSNTYYYRAWYYVASQSTDLDMANVWGNPTDTLLVSLFRQNSTGKICLRNEVTASVAGCSAASVSTGAWHKIEFRVTSATTTTGTLQLWVDDVLELNITNANQATNQYLTEFNFGTMTSGQTGTFYVDDFAMDSAARVPDSASLYVSDTITAGGSFAANGPSFFGGPVQIQPTSNNVDVFTVKNSSGATLLGVDSTPINSIISNPSFEKSSSTLTDWTAKTGTTGNVGWGEAYSGLLSANLVTTATANTGLKYVTGNTSPTQLATSTTYSFSWYSKNNSGTALTDLVAAYARDGSTETTCTGQNTQTSITGSWTRHTCTITTDGTAPAATAYLIIKQVGATAHNFFIDAVQIEAAATPTAYRESQLQLNGVITSPTVFKNMQDSTTAFQVQLASGNSLLNVDTTTSKLTVDGSTYIGDNFGSRLFSDGFESGDFSAWNGWQAQGGESVSSTIKRTGNYAAKLTFPNAGVWEGVSGHTAPTPTLYTTFYVYVASASTDVGFYSHYVYNYGVNEVMVNHVFRRGSDGKVCIYNGVTSTTVGCTAASVSTGAWHKITMRTTVATAVTGTTQLWVDGVQEVNLTTTNNGTTNLNGYELDDTDSGVHTGVVYIDDLQIGTVDLSSADPASLYVSDTIKVGNGNTITSDGASFRSLTVQPTNNNDLTFQVQQANGYKTLFVNTASNYVQVGGELWVRDSVPGYIDLIPLGGGVEIGSGDDPQSQIDFRGSANLAADYEGRIAYDDNGGFYFNTNASANVALMLGLNGAATFQSNTDSLKAFGVRDAFGSYILNVDTSKYYTIDNGTKNYNNLIDNGSFEGGDTDWGSSGWDTNANTTINTSNPYRGLRNYQITTTGSAQDLGNLRTIPVSPGEVYYLEGYVKRSAGGGGTGGYYIVLDNASDTGATYYNSSFTDPGTTYAQREISVVIPATCGGSPCVKMAVYMKVDAAATGTWYYDDVFVQQTSSRATLTTGAVSVAAAVSSGSTQTISQPGTTYYLSANSSTTNSSFTTTFNITGLPAADGTVAIIKGVSIKGATTGAQTHTVVIQINGTTFMTLAPTAGTGATTLTRSFIATRMSGTWYIVGMPLTTNPANTAGQATTADFAEWIRYSGETQPQPGEVLVVGDDPTSVKLSGNSYQKGLIGVVSTDPYQVAGADDGHSVILALTGRVPVKVSLENGPIQKGDKLTSSSTPGVAMKAIRAGTVIGTALEDYDGTQTSNQITVQLQVGYDVPDTNIATSLQGSDLNLTGNAIINGGVTIGAGLNVSGETTLNKLIVNGDAVFNGNLTVQNITVANITINGHIITAGNTPTIAVGAAAGAEDTVNNIPAPQVTITGNDTSGTITIVAGSNTTAGEIAKLTFASAFNNKPRVVFTPANRDSAKVGAYYDASLTTNNEFGIFTDSAPERGKTYTFTYFITE